MFELSAAELDGEMAVELPTRELMSRMHHSGQSSFIGSVKQVVIQKNIFSWDSYNEAYVSQVVVVAQIQK